MISSYSREREFSDSDAIILQKILKDNQLHAGVSRPFTSLDYLKKHYSQSLDALNLGMHIDNDISIYNYDNYAIYHIAKVCADSSDLKEFCHPKLASLIEFDAEHKTSFTDSLYAYLGFTEYSKKC